MFNLSLLSLHWKWVWSFEYFLPIDTLCKSVNNGFGQESKYEKLTDR